MSLPSVSLVIPAYNERRAIAATIRRAVALLPALPAGSELLVVDDGSTDGTSDRLRFPTEAIRVLRHQRNRGYGRALKTGIRAAKNPIIAICDADGTYPMEEIPTLLERLTHEDAAMIVGQRAVASQPAIRRPAKAILKALAEYLSNESIPDMNSGLRLFRREDALRHQTLLPEGFSFTTTITMALLADGERVLYHPVSYSDRVGRSKIRPIRDSLNFIFLICRMALAFSPMKVFGPMGFLLIGAGILLLVARMAAPVPFGAVTTMVLLVGGFQVLAIGLLADLINRRGRG